MKKGEKTLYLVLIFILVAVVLCGGTYIAMEMKYKNSTNQSQNANPSQNENKNEATDGVTLKNVESKNNQIVETFELVLNGNKQTIEVVFTEEKGDTEENDVNTITGTFNGKEVYKYMTYDSETFTTDEVKSLFNESKFKIIKGVDKNYLGLVRLIDNPAAGLAAYLYFLNDALEYLEGDFPYMCFKSNEYMTIREYQTGFELEGNKTFGYSDEFDFYPAEEWQYHSLNTVSIKDDGIYYMVPIMDGTVDYVNDYGTAEERIYTINNDKITYTILKTYKIVGVAGQAC